VGLEATAQSTSLVQQQFLEATLNMVEAVVEVVATRTCLALLETEQLVAVHYMVLEAGAEEWLI
tara:strand:- start:137 stop:328 length:192 start_codon:yes stop_codon:yes gene_type:complete